MRLFHLSDTHGLPRMQVPDDIDIIVHSGDLFPNATWNPPDKHIEPGFQEGWFNARAGALVKWIGDATFLYVPGNHDWFDPCPLLRARGVTAHNLWTEGPITVLDGPKFVGLPFVICANDEGRFYGWNYERRESEMTHHIETAIDQEPDVLVTHCPPFGILDCPYERFDKKVHIGSKGYRSMLIRKGVTVNGVLDGPFLHAPDRKRPKHWLFGHCHEQGGAVEIMVGTTFYNNATTHMVIEV